MANVAAEQPVTDPFPEFRCRHAAQLDRQVADTAGGVQYVRLWKSAGWACIQTRSASPAVVRHVRRVIGQLLIRQQRRQEDPTAGLPIEQQRILADPTQTGQLREFALQQRCGVYDTSYGRSRHEVFKKSAQPAQTVVNHVVIIPGAPGVSRDAALARCVLCRFVRAVVRAQHEHTSHAVQDMTRMLVSAPTIRQVVHFACVASFDPLLEPLESLRRHRRRCADQAEPETSGFLLQKIAERFGIHVSRCPTVRGRQSVEVNSILRN